MAGTDALARLLPGWACGGVRIQSATYLASGAKSHVFAVKAVGAGGAMVAKVSRETGAAAEGLFAGEAAVLRDLAVVPGVVRCVASGAAGGHPVLLLSRAEGTSFIGEISGTPAFLNRAVEQLLEVGLGVLQRGVVNTDQHTNVLFAPDGAPTFLDFGAAVRLEGVSAGFRDFYVKTYWRELFSLVPPSHYAAAERTLCARGDLATLRLWQEWRGALAKEEEPLAPSPWSALASPVLAAPLDSSSFRQCCESPRLQLAVEAPVTPAPLRAQRERIDSLLDALRARDLGDSAPLSPPPASPSRLQLSVEAPDPASPGLAAQRQRIDELLGVLSRRGLEADEEAKAASAPRDPLHSPLEEATEEAGLVAHRARIAELLGALAASPTEGLPVQPPPELAAQRARIGTLLQGLRGADLGADLAARVQLSSALDAGSALEAGPPAWRQAPGAWLDSVLEAGTLSECDSPTWLEVAPRAAAADRAWPTAPRPKGAGWTRIRRALCRGGRAKAAHP